MTLTPPFYYRLPVTLQNAAVSLYGLWRERRRFGSDFEKKLALVCERAATDHESMIAYRDNRLAVFVRHAAKTTPYYRELFRKNGIDPNEIRTISDLSWLPILDKNFVARNRDQFISEAIDPNKVIWARTSGTTGGGLVFPVTLSAHQEQWATWWRYRSWHGIDRSIWHATFTERSIAPADQTKPPFWRMDYVGRQIFFSPHHISEENIRHYIDHLNRFKPRWLTGRPSLISELASYMNRTGHGLDYQLEWITLGAENLLAHQRHQIQRAFGITPVQHYGMEEGVANISEHPDHTLRIDEDFAAVELVPSDMPGLCKVVGTNFSNPAFPLLRYDVGDLVSADELPARSGAFRRIIRTLDGRTDDFVVLRDGRKAIGLNNLFAPFTDIAGAQITQTEPGEVMICLVKGSGFSSETETKLRQGAAAHLGADTRIDVKYVDTLVKTSNGKVRLVISSAGRVH